MSGYAGWREEAAEGGDTPGACRMRRAGAAPRVPTMRGSSPAAWRAAKPLTTQAFCPGPSPARRAAPMTEATRLKNQNHVNVNP